MQDEFKEFENRDEDINDEYDFDESEEHEEDEMSTAGRKQDPFRIPRIRIPRIRIPRVRIPRIRIPTPRVTVRWSKKK